MIHFSSKTAEWSTPQDLFDKLDAEFHFNLDPCATKENAKCELFYTKEDNGLSKDWSGKTVFMNPPYGREIRKWVEKAKQSNATVVCLLPARTDTFWWHEYVIGSEVRFIRGRLKFGDSDNEAPFPSAIVIFRPDGSIDQNKLYYQIERDYEAIQA
jgi:phage N-6-adenine-methyltransferase